MDRLIIESTLADVNEFFLSEAENGEIPETTIVLGFRAPNAENVAHAWSVLKEIADKHEVELVICKAMVAGVYDLEIKTPALDEPLRIMNKSISNEAFTAIEELVATGRSLSLATSASEKEDRIAVHTVTIRECAAGN